MTRSLISGLVLCCGICLALTMLRATDPAPLVMARELIFDQYQRLAPRSYQPVPVRVVDIDEASLAKIGQWPWPRDKLVLLVERLTALGAASIAFDVLFSEPDRLSPRAIMAAVPSVDPASLAKIPDNDETFAAAIKDSNVVLGFGITNRSEFRPSVKAGIAFTGESVVNAPPRFQGATPILPALEQAAAGVGHISLNPSTSSAVIRKIPLFLTDGAQLYPGLALEALRLAQGANTYLLSGSDDEEGRLAQVKDGEAIVPVTAAGELWLYVTPDTASRYVSVADLLTDQPTDKLREAIEGNIVFVGTSAAGLQDIRVTALGENVPGVSLHAQAVEQIISGEFLSRPDWLDGVEVLATLMLGTVLVGLTFFATPVVALAVGLFLTGCAFIVSWIAFTQAHVLIDPFAPVVSGSLTHFASTAYRFLVSDRDRRKIRHAFGQYVSPNLLARVDQHSNALDLGGEEKTITVMFVDVRNFTSISESKTPTEVVRFLNTLLGELSDCVIKNDGTLDKFIGDSIMAFWNAPFEVVDHPRKAVRAALQMRSKLKELNASDAFGFGLDVPVNIGIGIHSGLACVGNMGAKTRFNYSAIGDAVNTASRIESACKTIGIDILVSKQTQSYCEDFATLKVGEVPLKGKRQVQTLYAVIGDETTASSADWLDLVETHRAYLDASRTGADGGEFAAMRRAGELVSPELAEFYDRMAERQTATATDT